MTAGTLLGAALELTIYFVAPLVLAYVVLILLKHPAEVIEQGPRAERLWRPLLAANLGLCISHAGIVGIFVTLEPINAP